MRDKAATTVTSGDGLGVSDAPYWHLLKGGWYEGSVSVTGSKKSVFLLRHHGRLQRTRRAAMDDSHHLNDKRLEPSWLDANGSSVDPGRCRQHHVCLHPAPRWMETHMKLSLLTCIYTDNHNWNTQLLIEKLVTANTTIMWPLSELIGTDISHEDAAGNFPKIRHLLKYVSILRNDFQKGTWADVCLIKPLAANNGRGGAVTLTTLVR